MENKTENSLFDTANELYFKPVEGENGFQLDVEDDIRNRLVGLVEDRWRSHCAIFSRKFALVIGEKQ